MNFVYSLFVPLGTLAAYNVVRVSSVKKHEATYLPLLISISLACFVTDIIKNAVGRPRPDLLARCVPSQGVKPDTLVTITACQAPNNHKLQDGFRSFPSGHSSFAFAGLGFVSLFFAGQFRLFNLGSHRDLTQLLFCLAPFIGALLIAISRCEDYRHDVYDVCVGGAIGFTAAYWSYRRYWPQLSSTSCSEPYASGTESPSSGWQRVRDEEQGQGEQVELGPVSNSRG